MKLKRSGKSLRTKCFGEQDCTYHLERMRHFDDCVATNTPSPHCRDNDPVENLNWCRLGLRIESDNFAEMLGEILMRQDADAKSGTD